MADKRLLHNILQIVILVFFLLLTVVVYSPIKNAIDTRLEEIKGAAIGEIEALIGEKIGYESIAPSIFSFIEIRGFKIYDPEYDSAVLLSIDRLKIYYDIWNIFTGKTENIIKEIGIEHTKLEFDQQRDQKLIDFYTNMLSKEGNGNGFDIKKIDLVVSGKNIDLILRNQDGEVTLNDLFFDITMKPEGYAVQLKGDLNAGLTKPVFEISQCTTSLEIKGQTDYTFSWADLTAKIKSFRSDLFSMEDQTFYLNYQNDTLEMRKIQDTLPIDISVQYLTMTNDLFIEFQAEKFRPSQLVSLREDHPVYPWLSTLVNGSGAARYNLNTESIDYEFDGSVWVYNRFVPGRIGVTCQLTGDTSHVEFSSLYGSTIYGNIYYSGILLFDGLYPTGYVALSDLALPLDMPVRVGAYVKTVDGNLDIKTNYLAVGDTEFKDVDILFQPNDPLVSLKSFALKGGFALKGQESDHEVAFTANIDISKGFSVNADLTTRNISISRLYSLAFPDNPYNLPLDEYGDRFYLTTKMNVATDLTDYSVSASTFITDKVDPVNFAAFNIDINNQDITIKKYSVAWDIFRSQGSGQVALYPGGIVHVKTDLEFQKTPYSLDLLLMDSGNILFKGSYGLEGMVSGLGQKIGVVRLSCADLPVPLNPDEPLLVSIDADCIINNNNLNLYLSDAKVKGSGIEYVDDNNISLSVNLGMDYCHLYKINFTDKTSSLTGNGYVTFDLNSLKEYKGWVQLFNAETKEEYNLGVYINDDSIESTISFNRSPLARVTQFGVELPLSGYVAGSGVVAGTISDLDLDLTAVLSLQEGRFNDEPIALDFKTHVNRKKIAISELNCDYNEILFRGFGVEYAIETGGAGITGSIKGEYNDLPYSTNLFLALILEQGGDLVEIQDIIEAGFSGYLAVTDINYSNLDVEDLSFQFSHLQGVTSFEGGPDDIFKGEFHNTGEFSLDLRDPLPVQLNVSGKIEEGRIEAELKNIAFDLVEIWSYIDMPFVKFTNGKAHGQIKIYGNMNDPDFNGILTISNAGLETPFVKNAFEPFQARFFFKEKEIRLAEINFENDVTSFRADGFIHIDHWLPSEYTIGIKAMEPKGVQVDYDFPGVAVDGVATGTLELIGTLNGLTVKGDMLAESGIVTISGAQSSGEEEKSDFAFVLDLKVETGTNVEFIWPNTTFPVFRAYSQSGNVVNIYNNSLEEHYSIKGEAVLKIGEVDLQQFGKFIINEGSIAFDEDESGFNPVIKARAEKRVRTKDGQVIIYIVVDGPFKDFSNPRLLSDPPMSAEEIWALFGVTTDFTLDSDTGESKDLELIDVLSFAAGYGSELALGALKFEDTIKDVFGLDFVYFETEILERIVRSFSDPYTNITDYLGNTVFIGGRYISDDIFLRGDVTLKSLTGIDADSGLFGSSLGFQTEIGAELQTPLFVVKPTFNLKYDGAIENFWTLSLTKRISY